MPGSQRGEEFHLKGSDEVVNDDEIAEELMFEELCASGDCSSMPTRQKMQIKVISHKVV